MLKAAFLKLLRRKADLASDAQAEAVYRGVLDALAESLRRGEPVAIGGFGTFKVVNRCSRKGRHPRTGEELLIPAAKAVKFTPGKALKSGL